MLKGNENINKVENIICYTFKNKEPLIKLFNQTIPYSQQAINNGEQLFVNLMKKLIAKDQKINPEWKNDYLFDALDDYQKPRFWQKQLTKLTLNQYRDFNNEEARDFVYCLLDAISKDSNWNESYLIHTFDKLLYYNYLMHHPILDADLNWDYLFGMHQNASLMMEIDCNRFITYSHQNMQELWAYLYYCYQDLFNKYYDDNDEIKNVWKTIDLDKDYVKQFDQICQVHHFYTGTCFLHDKYYWYCLMFVGKFKYCFTSKNEKKDDAKNQAIKEFIRYYQQDQIKEPLPIDPVCKDLNTQLYIIQSRLGIPNFGDDDNYKKIDWATAKKTNLIHKLNKANLFNLVIYHFNDKQSNCTLLVNGCAQAFSANGMGETNSLANANQLLIDYYLATKH